MAKRTRSESIPSSGKATIEEKNFHKHTTATAAGLASILLLYPGTLVCAVSEGFDEDGNICVHKNGNIVAFIRLSGF